jgi:hypothetical protein
MSYSIVKRGFLMDKICAGIHKICKDYGLSDYLLSDSTCITETGDIAYEMHMSMKTPHMKFACATEGKAYITTSEKIKCAKRIRDDIVIYLKRKFPLGTQGAIDGSYSCLEMSEEDTRAKKYALLMPWDIMAEYRDAMPGAKSPPHEMYISEDSNGTVTPSTADSRCGWDVYSLFKDFECADLLNGLIY